MLSVSAGNSAHLADPALTSSYASGTALIGTAPVLSYVEVSAASELFLVLIECYGVCVNRLLILNYADSRGKGWPNAPTNPFAGSP